MPLKDTEICVIFITSLLSRADEMVKYDHILKYTIFWESKAYLSSASELIPEMCIVQQSYYFNFMLLCQFLQSCICVN